MTFVELKFSPEMARAVLDGRKCCTARWSVKGVSGDEFKLDGVRFRIIDVMAETAATVAYKLCRLEGFGGYRACFETLRRIYPEIDCDSILFVHYFARCP